MANTFLYTLDTTLNTGLGQVMTALGLADNSVQAAENTSYLGPVILSSGGLNYTTVPTVVFTGGNGSGAVATAVLGVLSVTLGGTNSGYSTPPTVTFSGGGATTQATAHTTLSGGVATVIVDTPGVGYTSLPTVTISANGSGAATGTAVLTVVSVVLSSPGSGYTTIPVISFTGGGGTGATATTSLVGGVVNQLTVLADNQIGNFIVSNNAQAVPGGLNPVVTNDIDAIDTLLTTIRTNVIAAKTTLDQILLTSIKGLDTYFNSIFGQKMRTFINANDTHSVNPQFGDFLANVPVNFRKFYGRTAVDEFIFTVNAQTRTSGSWGNTISVSPSYTYTNAILYGPVALQIIVGGSSPIVNRTYTISITATDPTTNKSTVYTTIVGSTTSTVYPGTILSVASGKKLLGAAGAGTTLTVSVSGGADGDAFLINTI